MLSPSLCALCFPMTGSEIQTHHSTVLPRYCGFRGPRCCVPVELCSHHRLSHHKCNPSNMLEATFLGYSFFLTVFRWERKVGLLVYVILVINRTEGLELMIFIHDLYILVGRPWVSGGQVRPRVSHAAMQLASNPNWTR